MKKFPVVLPLSLGALDVVPMLFVGLYLLFSEHISSAAVAGAKSQHGVAGLVVKIGQNNRVFLGQSTRMTGKVPHRS